MIITVEDVKSLYKNTPEDVNALKYDVDMMSLGLCGMNTEQMISWGNYYTVLNEYLKSQEEE